LDAVDRARLVIAGLFLLFWQALCTTILAACNLSFEHLLSTTALLGALFFHPLGHGTIRKKARVTITLHLVKLTTNLSEGANLAFQLEVVAATGGHLGLDVIVEARVVLSGDNGILR